MPLSHPILIRLAVASAPLALWALAVPGAPQSVGRPVVQPIPGSDGMRLNAALGRLARNPRDVDALVEAGMASLAAGDGDAAIGFYQKADVLAPGSARIKAGLAGAYALSGDPVSAIPLFDEAERSGVIEAARVADRGLAFDMVGDAVTAQRYYHEALMAGPNEETSRRLALSQAIAGDRRGMEVTLAPLLQRQDKAAWRTRALALAILGQTEEADSIARSTMPADLASSISGYLRYMPKLTPAQQAAAANLGRFPRAAEIGSDDPRLAALVRTRPVLASAAPLHGTAAKPSARLAKRDEAKRDRKREAKPPKDPVPAKVVAAVVPPPVVQPAKAPVVTSAAPVKLAVNTVSPPKPALVVDALPPAPAPTPVPAPPPAPAVEEPKPQPGFASLDNPASSFDLKPAVPAPAPKPVPAAKVAAKPRSLSEVFADLTPPSREAEAQAGAVDLRKLRTAPTAKTPDSKTARDKACEALDPKAARNAKGKAPAAKTPAAVCKDDKGDKAKGPSHPSRIWVQVATGKDKKGLAFDWRKLAKDDPALFKGRKGYVSAWGQTNRLLTGPFDTNAQAAAFIAQLKKAGVGGAFAWNSPAGQVVDALPGG